MRLTLGDIIACIVTFTVIMLIAAQVPIPPA